TGYVPTAGEAGAVESAGAEQFGTRVHVGSGRVTVADYHPQPASPVVPWRTEMGEPARRFFCELFPDPVEAGRVPGNGRLGQLAYLPLDLEFRQLAGREVAIDPRTQCTVARVESQAIGQPIGQHRTSCPAPDDWNVHGRASQLLIASEQLGAIGIGSRQ